MADRFGTTTEGRLERIELQLDSIELALKNFIVEGSEALQRLVVGQQTRGDIIVAEIDDLIAVVEEVKGVQDSAVRTINDLADRMNTLVQNSTDLASLKAAVAAETQKVHDNALPLAAAVAANP